MRIRISDPRPLGTWYIWPGIRPLNRSDLGPLILNHIIPKERTEKFLEQVLFKTCSGIANVVYLFSDALFAISSKLRKSTEFDLPKAFLNTCSSLHFECKLALGFAEICRHAQYALKGTALTARATFIVNLIH